MDFTDYLKPSQLNRQKRRDKRLYEELIECRRYNGGDKNKKYREAGRRRRLQDQVKSGSLPYRERICPDSRMTFFSDNLEPLERFLRTHTGQPWDEVYSKLATQLDKSTTTGLHVYQHLDWFVQKTIHKRWWFSSQFYVDQSTGLLEERGRDRKNNKGPFPKKARWKKLKEKNKLKRKLGIPVATPVINAPKCKPIPKQMDVVMGEVWKGRYREVGLKNYHFLTVKIKGGFVKKNLECVEVEVIKAAGSLAEKVKENSSMTLVRTGVNRYFNSRGEYRF